MKNNYKQRIKDFFKKEGFYVVLFVCICLVATVTAISYKQSKNDVITNTSVEDEEEENNNELSLNMEEKNKTNEMQNAEVAKNNEDNKENQNKDNAKTTSTSGKLNLEKPVEGKILRGYTYPKPVMIDENNQRTIRGIDIEAKIGTEVKAAEDGVVEKVENTGVEDGMTIIIKHANGIKTKYTNLNDNVKVKVSQTVKKGTVIGNVGETAKLYDKEKFGEHLNLQVLNYNEEQINPLNYYSYK